MTTSKGGRKATGSVRILRLKTLPHAKCWHARFTYANGERTDFRPLPDTIALDDREAAKAYAAKVAEVIVRDGIIPDSVRETVAEYAARWLSDRDGRVNSIRDDRSRLRMHVLPELGLLDVATFGRDDVEKLRDALDAKIVTGRLSWKTVACVWTLVTSVCADMMSAKKRELRVRDDNPCRDVKPPERGSRKAKQYLYPAEFLQLVSCPEVPLRWRRAVALAVYLFPRDGELRELRWDGGDVDLERGVLAITRAFNARSGEAESTKSGETRRFAVDANVLPLLQAMHDEAKGRGTVVGWHELHMSRGLRRWLKKAGVTRPELHKGSPTRKPLTWHDLRATGLTWLAVRGDDPLKIKQRAGHASFSTTELYIREAEAVRDAHFGDVFPPLPDALLSSGPVSARPEQKLQSSLKQAVFGAGHESRTRDLRLGKRSSNYASLRNHTHRSLTATHGRRREINRLRGDAR